LRLPNTSLAYLFASQISALVVMAMVNLTADQYGGHARWADTFWFAARFGVAAAVLHPAVNRLTTPQRAYPDDMSARSLMTTGAVLSVNRLASRRRRILHRRREHRRGPRHPRKHGLRRRAHRRSRQRDVHRQTQPQVRPHRRVSAERFQVAAGHVAARAQALLWSLRAS
jgi:hypothetical protein